MADNSGRFSKFQERIRNIRLSRSKRMRFQKENEQFIQEKIAEIKEKVREDGGVYRVRVVRGIGEVKKKEEVKELQKNDVSEEKTLSKSTEKVNDLQKSEVKDIRVSSDMKKADHEVFLEEKKEVLSDEEDYSKENVIEKEKKEFKENRVSKEKNKLVRRSYSKKHVGISNHSQDNQEKLKELGSEIIDKIKEQFESYLDEVDVLASELFLIRDKQENEVELAKVLELKKRINELIKKLNAVIEQYNLYKRNNYIDGVIGIEDNSIVDDMIEYRELLDNEVDKKKFTSEYKALDEFNSLYLALQRVREDTIVLQEDNQDKIFDYQDRDKKYKVIKDGVVDEIKILNDCNEEIRKQDDYFDQLMSKIGKINQVEYTTYELRGINQLLGNGLRYVGLMMLSPFSGLLPSIGIQTLLTRRMVQNTYRGIHLEEKNHVRYEAIDYEKDIFSKLTDIRYTSYLIEDTLSHVEKLKSDFLMQYSSDIPHYEEILQKILKIENLILHQQNKVDIIQKRLLKGKKLNNEKMMKVKRLNEKAS